MTKDENLTFVTGDSSIHKKSKLDLTDIEILKSAKSDEKPPWN